MHQILPAMKPQINIITVAVDDLQRSLAFYRDGLGLAAGMADGGDHIAFHLHGGLSFVLYDRAALARDAHDKEVRQGSAQFLLTHYVDQKEQVDKLLKRAAAAGATVVGPAEEQPWGYVGRFKDVDGHLWEVLWNAP